MTERQDRTVAMGRRKLSDSDARWEAALAIAVVMDDYINGGGLSLRAEHNGWTEADQIAVEKLVLARCEGLLRRAPSPSDSGSPSQEDPS